MLGYPQHAASCRRGSEMGRAGGKEVVCPYGQRQVAAIALRAPCSGIKIKDDKQTNKLLLLSCGRRLSRAFQYLASARNDGLLSLNEVFRYIWI